MEALKQLYLPPKTQTDEAYQHLRDKALGTARHAAVNLDPQGLETLINETQALEDNSPLNKFIDLINKMYVSLTHNQPLFDQPHIQDIKRAQKELYVQKEEINLLIKNVNKTITYYDKEVGDTLKELETAKKNANTAKIELDTDLAGIHVFKQKLKDNPDDELLPFEQEPLELEVEQSRRDLVHKQELYQTHLDYYRDVMGARAEQKAYGALASYHLLLLNNQERRFTGLLRVQSHGNPVSTFLKTKLSRLQFASKEKDLIHNSNERIKKYNEATQQMPSEETIRKDLRSIPRERFTK